jgi:putative phosphotransacetylase
MEKMTDNEIACLVKKVLEELGGASPCEKGCTEDGVPVGVSNRHIHLSEEHVSVLFGKGYELTPMKELSQPGQYACKEVLTIVGPSLRPIENVRVLGPVRRSSQVEISATDSYTLKVKPPVRESGKTEGSAPITIIGPKGVVALPEGCIIANRHIHMSPDDGARFGVSDGDYVTVDVEGKRRTRWYDVQVRVHPDFRLEMHVDTDDANAVGIGNGCKVKIVHGECCDCK